MTTTKKTTTPKQSKIPKHKKSKTVFVYAGAFVGIIALVAMGYSSSHSRLSADSQSQASVASITTAPDVSSTTPVSNTIATQAAVSDVVATSIAADVAQTSDLPIANNVSNLATSLTAEQALDQSQSDSSVITKPQLVDPSSQRQSIVSYTAKAGDTVESVAATYGLSKDTIKWTNNLTSDALDAGKQLQILPVDGILYTVKDGDTEDSIAAKYHVDKDRLVTFNNLDLSNVKTGMQLILPSGQLPETERPGYQAPSTRGTVATGTTTGGASSATSSFFASGSVGNRYAYGECTYYAYARRAAMGRPVGSFWGNANSWAAAASASGYLVDSNPAPGDVFQTTAGYYGHVGIVESVDTAAGTLTYSDMNGVAGWGRVGTRTISLSEARSLYRFIH